MLNKIWAALILVSIACAVMTGRVPQLSEAVFQGAGSAVELILSLAGMMAAWTGLLKIADAGGVTALLSRALRPFMRLLFPEFGKDDPAAKAICMNITANLLGLGNASTPLGLAAMKEMAKRRPGPRASNAMVRFVVLNTASVQLIPTTLSALRARYGAASPLDIMPAVWVTSMAALLAGLLVERILEGRRHG